MKSSMKETSDPPSVISTTDRDLDDFVTKPGPSKTWNQRTTWRRARRIAWALRTFTDWRDERNKCSAIQAKCPLGLLENPDTEKVNNAGYLASSWKPDARTHSESYIHRRSTCLLLY